MRPIATLLARPFALAALLFGVGSCTVYAPMQPTMPLVQAVGQAEASANIQPNGRLETTVAYSPAPNLVVTAGGTVCPKLGNSNFLVTRQYELGVGGYWPLGSSSWLFNGLGGYGQAVNNRGYKDLNLFYGSSYNEYNARYNKVFAQVGLANVKARHSLGFTYRLTQVHFSTLTDTQLGDLPLTNMLRHEGLFFFRHALGGGSGHWESLATVGLSASTTAKRNDNPDYPSTGAAEYQANRNLLPAFYASLGVVYHPHWGGR